MGFCTDGKRWPPPLTWLHSNSRWNLFQDSSGGVTRDTGIKWNLMVFLLKQIVSTVDIFAWRYQHGFWYVTWMRWTVQGVFYHLLKPCSSAQPGSARLSSARLCNAAEGEIQGLESEGEREGVEEEEKQAYAVSLERRGGCQSLCVSTFW